MCCSDPPPPPDLSGMAESSEEIARISQETAMAQLDWAREQDAMNRETLNRVLDTQLPVMEEQAGYAREDRERYQTLFQPLEDQFVREAQEFDSPEKKREAAGRALSQVNQQFDAQRRNSLQRLESYGVDPSQTRNAALDIGVRTAQAQAAVQAATNAENRVEDVGRAMRGDAINIGRGLPGQAAAGYGGATGTGSAAVGGANQTTGTSAGAFSGAAGWMGTALGGYGQSANIHNMGYGNQMAGWQAKQDQRAGTLQAIGSVAGMAMMADGGDVEDAEMMPDGTYAIPHNRDGHVPEIGRGDGSGIDDTVPAQLSEGEYVIPADVVKAKGTEFFDRLVEKYHTPAAEQEQRAA
jgi:hypothetical protein